MGSQPLTRASLEEGIVTTSEELREQALAAEPAAAPEDEVVARAVALLEETHRRGSWT
jgi:hypothetical protein